MRPRGTRWIVRAGLVLALTACGRPFLSHDAPDAPARGPLLIHGVGDVGLDPRQIPDLATDGYRRAWSGLGGMFTGDDLTIVNLECPVTDHVAPMPKPVTFRCDPRALPAAGRAGVDVVSQANNHAADQGIGGLLDSSARIRAAGFVVVGSGVDRAESLAAGTIHRGGWTVAVLGVDQVSEPASVAGMRTAGTAPGRDFGRVLSSIVAAGSEADLVIVMVHWGLEGSSAPTSLQRRQAHQMVDAGADVIFGSHAHRLQDLEIYRGRPIYYGLGNAVWPRAEGASGGIGEVLARPDGSIEARILPLALSAHGHPTLAGA